MDVYIVGTAMSKFGILSNKSIKDLVKETVNGALLDANLSKTNLDAAFFSSATQSALQGQHMIPGQVALRSIGIEDIPVVNVENACASASTAFSLAVKDIKSGDSDIVLAVGADKMNIEDKNRMMNVFEGAIDVSEREETFKKLLSLSEDFDLPPEANIDGGKRSIFMDVYAAFAKQHMKNFGTTQRQMAAVSSKNHSHSVHNPLSQFQKDFSIEEVLGARLISWPFTLPMCSPISDGSSAAILMSEKAMKAHGISKRRSIRVLASIISMGINRKADDQSEHITARAARKAYEKAGVGPEDVNLAEVHDASAIAEIMQIENLGFCNIGEGGPFSESGATTIGGKIPVNPSGGLESKGHPIGTTGLAQIHELTMQLRGEAEKRQVDGARIAIAENGGGTYGIEEATACITILEKT